MKRLGWAFCAIVCMQPPLHALDVEVNSSFKISGITRSEGKLRLPAERKIYYNVRILSKGTYDFLSTCEEPCLQKIGELTPSVLDVRPVKTREQMWVASVDFGHAWLITFLVFGTGNEYSIKVPQNFAFLDEALEQQTRRAILGILNGQNI